MPPYPDLSAVLARIADEPSRLEAVLDESPEPLIAFDRTRVILAANAPADRYYGYERGALKGKSVDILIPARFRQPNAPAPIATPDITRVEINALRGDGSEVPTVWSYVGGDVEDRAVFVMNVRAQAEMLAELEKSTYAAVFEHSPVPIVLSRVADGITIAMNQAFADLFELKREHFIGRPSREMNVATSEQREEIARLLAADGALREHECERRTWTGKRVQVLLSITRVRIGTADHLMSTVQDISHRKAQAAALAAAQKTAEQERQKLRAILMQAPLPIAMLEGPDLVFTFANPRYVALVGGRDVVGKPLFEALPDVRGTGFDELLAGVRDNGERVSANDVSVKLAHHRPNEKLIIDFVCEPIFEEDGSVGAVLAIITDVTERATTNAELKRTAAALAESRARADYAVRLAGIGFWYCDLPFDELAWDAKVKEHFFLPPDARVTIDLFYERIVPEDRDRTRTAIDKSIREHGVYDVNYRTHDPATGQIKWVRAMGGTSYAADGTPIRFDGVTVDITSQKRNEERLASSAAELAEANRVKDEFLAMLGHELRNPLSPITTAVQLMRLRGIESREVSIIARQAQHLTRLVDDLLDVSRITRGKVTLERQPREIAEIVAAAVETVSPLVETARHTLVVEVPARGLVVDVDRTRMVQVVSNLLTNAAKYTRPGGRITVRATRAGSDVVLAVEDTGEGISAELLPHVFDMFVQSRQTLARSQGGLGLGLAIVQSLMKLHGGSVSVASPGVGQGSTFTLRLPSAVAAVKTESARPAAANVSNGGRRVLVVDDNVDGAEMIADALRALGHFPSIANDGAQALEVAAATMPEIALVDIGLPVIDGYELARRLRESHPSLHLVAMTGYGQPADRERSRDAGFTEHVTKPVDIDRLGELVAELESSPV